MATMGLARLLPKPQRSYQVHQDEPSPVTMAHLQITTKRQVPPYGHRQNFVPRSPEDFNDGGAFPEVHVAQYPLNMGKKDGSATSTAIVAVDVGSDGKVNFDAIVKQGTNRNKTVFTKLSDMKERDADEDLLAKPTTEEETEAAAKTRRALEAIIGTKVAAARPTQIAGKPAEEPTHVRYRANPTAPGYNPAAKERVIELVEAQVDPMEPSRHKHKKIPRGAPEDPTPVMHSPPRKVTVADQEAWKIPPSISNWKNAKGYCIPLDKRLAADGRGLQELAINPKFGALPQALYIAEEKARENIAARATIDQKIKKLEREQKEEELRQLAARSRAERSGLTMDEDDEPSSRGGGGGQGRLQDRLRQQEEEEEEEDRGGMTEEQRVAASQREKLRIERRKEMERDMRKDNMKGAMRKTKLDRDGERDVSEKIALGMHVGKAKLTGEEIYDARLFNQGGGVAGDFGAEDDYNVYSKALFDKGPGSNIYRPRGEAFKDAEADGDDMYKKLSTTEKFRPDKGFAGADYGSGGGGREKPVQFEKEGARQREERGDGGGKRRGGRDEEDDDFFGVGQLMDDGRKEGRKDPLGHIGSGGRGMMAGSSAGKKEDYDQGSKRQKIGFSEAGSRRRERSPY